MMSATTIAYGYLALAIICEVLGTTFMAKSAEFTRWAPTAAMAALYSISLFFLARSLRVIPLGVAYAIWGGLGIVLTSIVGLLVFKQSLGLPAILGITLIVTGVIILNIFSTTLPH